jgi:OOP family OmpA-OmpF porin
VKNGIDPSKIQILGKGESSPIADNATKDGRAKNRRVEVMVKGAVEGQ